MIPGCSFCQSPNLSSAFWKPLNKGRVLDRSSITKSWGVKLFVPFPAAITKLQAGAVISTSSVHGYTGSDVSLACMQGMQLLFLAGLDTTSAPKHDRSWSRFCHQAASSRPLASRWVEHIAHSPPRTVPSTSQRPARQRSGFLAIGYHLEKVPFESLYCDPQ